MYHRDFRANLGGVLYCGHSQLDERLHQHHLLDHHRQWPHASGDVYAGERHVDQQLSIDDLYDRSDWANTCRHLFGNFAHLGQLIHRNLVYHQQHRANGCGFVYDGQRIVWQQLHGHHLHANQHRPHSGFHLQFHHCYGG